jgi:hypothetical protein
VRHRKTGREGIYTRVVPGKRTPAEQPPKPHAQCPWCASNICQGECHDDECNCEFDQDPDDPEPSNCDDIRPFLLTK